MSIEIQKVLNTHNTGYKANRKIEYIVIHYTAGTHSDKGAARTVANFFATTSSASADFIVDDEEIVQYNPDIKNRYCYAVGDRTNTKAPYYKKCNNQNSISIELCSNNTLGQVTEAGSNYWYFTEATLNNGIKLIKHLQKLYNIDTDHIITHYLRSFKVCPGVPGYFGSDNSKWLEFKERIEQEEDEEMTQEQFNTMMDNYIAAKAAETTSWGNDDLNWGKENGLIAGDYQGNLMPNKFCTRLELVVILKRFYNMIIGK